ncbi:hypothetical protein GH714_010315 [Hevea brasiliensis]|uniref:TF-B3 domain-containing protein n=1 Tax=Hevea brasiliensis TaxID=3981 RepID=A0A6A6KMW6_HEVBR|nr:hypothetical protein GH714_010315 [Hevea brasiliensis]
MAADDASPSTYEEARKQRLEENKKRFEDLGILNISKSLSKLTSPEKKSKQRLPKPKPENSAAFEPRRSSRARNAVTSYSDDMDIHLPPLRKRSRFSSSWGSYVARPLEEVKLASYEDRARALRVAEEFQSSLQSGNPSFVKSMVRSHVYSCFWLGLPTQFCKDHLPKEDLDMILEDENGSTYDAKYLGKRNGLSGGWRGFALDHKLDDGDAVVFELVESDRFKIYTFRVSSFLLSSQAHSSDIVEKQGSTAAKKGSKDQKKTDSHSRQTRKSKKAKPDKNDKFSDDQKPQPRNRAINGGRSDDLNSVQENGFVSREHNNKDESVGKSDEVKSVDEKDKQEKCTIKPRKKPAPRLFRKKA